MEYISDHKQEPFENFHVYIFGREYLFNLVEFLSFIIFKSNTIQNSILDLCCRKVSEEDSEDQAGKLNLPNSKG